MSSRPRRINEMQADASRRRLEALFDNPRRDNALLEQGEVGIAENGKATLTQPASEKQGGCDA